MPFGSRGQNTPGLIVFLLIERLVVDGEALTGVFFSDYIKLK